MFYRFRSVTSVVLLTFVALFTLGCGDSHHEFVATGTGGGGPSLVNGSELVFRFERPVAAQTKVPATTASVRFDLFSSMTPSDASLISSEVRPYRDVIVIDDVSDTTKSVRVVLLDANGIPLGFYTAAVEVPPNSRVEVTLSESDFVPATMTALTLAPNPLEFFPVVGDPASTIAQLVATATIDGASYEVPIQDVTLTAEDAEVVSILSDGLVSVRVAILGLFGPMEDRPLNATTLTASYSLNDVSKQATVPVRVHRFVTVYGNLFTLITELSGFRFQPVDPGETLTITLGEDAAAYLSPQNELLEISSDELSYRLDSPSGKITFDPVTGTISVANDAPLGTVFSFETTWVDNRPGGSNHTYVERLTFKVSGTGPV